MFFNVRKIKFLLLAMLSMLLFLQESFASEAPQAILQGSIFVHPQSQTALSDKIQPGQSVKLSVIVENQGEIASPPSQIFIRYAFAKPLDKEPDSVLFETEKIALPIIQPGSSVEIAFDALHKWPALPDFIRHDWGMREYQALVDGKTIGSLAITFSAYYYPGIRKEIPQTFL